MNDLSNWGFGMRTLSACFLLSLSLVAGCGSDAKEGINPTECSDDADNDGDGAFDCDDSDCFGAPACADSMGDTSTGPMDANLRAHDMTQSPDSNADVSNHDGNSVGDVGIDGDSPDAADQSGGNPIVLVTSMGSISIRLDWEKAPITSENFQTYVESGFYDGDDGGGATTFHRVINGFMIQGGGVLADGQGKTTRPAIVSEANNGLSNSRGTVAMARTNDPDSATSQFFVNHVDNGFLDYVAGQNDGYAVFGKVVDGMDVVDAIADVATAPGDRPLETVTIMDVIWQ
jgi:cyclophilin family peptidyl-prolyl cis-trans isomerase